MRAGSPGGPRRTSSSPNPIAIDLLFGSSRERTLIESGPASEWARGLFEDEWRREELAFAERREPYLLYR